MENLIDLGTTYYCISLTAWKEYIIWTCNFCLLASVNLFFYRLVDMQHTYKCFKLTCRFYKKPNIEILHELIVVENIKEERTHSYPAIFLEPFSNKIFLILTVAENILLALQYFLMASMGNSSPVRKCLANKLIT